MKTHRVVFLIVLLHGVTFSKNLKSLDNYGQITEAGNEMSTEVDNVIQDVENKHWTDDEKPCVEKTLSILYNVKNFTLWAVWIWDSIPRPVSIFYGSKYQLGNYDQCMSAQWISVGPEIRTQYCLVDIKLTDTVLDGGNVSNYDSAVEYLKRPSKWGIHFEEMIWAVCLPTECRPSTVSKIMKPLFLRSYLSPLKNAKIQKVSCQSSAEKEQSLGFYLFITLFVILIAASLCSTYYMSQKSTSIEDHESQSRLIHNIAKSFDIKRNYEKLFEVKEDDMQIIILLRSSSAVLAVIVHHLLITGIVGASNGVDVDTDLNHFLASIMKHIEILINNFIVISGLLLMKNLMDKKQNLTVFLMKRYIRLLGPVAVMIFYFTSVSMHMGSGPLWRKLAGREQEACRNNWWLIPLMLNNFINTESMCQIVYWYIPCDFQLAVFGTLIYYMLRRNKRIGWFVLTVVSVYAIFSPGWAIHTHKLSANMCNGVRSMDLRRNDYFLKYYIKTQYRFGRYLVGMAVGYFMSMYPPLKYKKAISEKWSALMIALGSFFALSTLMMGGSLGDSKEGVVSAATFVTVSNVLYTLCICVVICGYEYGHGGFLKNISSIPAVVMVSRLSYCLYIVHIAIVQRSLYSIRSPPTYNLITNLTDGFGVCVVAVGASLCLWLLVEAPLSSLTNMLTKSRYFNQKAIGTVDTLQNGAKVQNGGQQNGDTKQKQL